MRSGLSDRIFLSTFSTLPYLLPCRADWLIFEQEVYHGDLTYQERIRQMLKAKSTRLVVSIDDLRHFNQGEIAVG